MGAISRIEEIYSDSSVKKRFISKSMFWVALAVAPPFVYGCVVNFLEGDTITGLIELVFAVFLFLGIYLIFKKKIDLFASSFVYAALIIGIGAGIITRESSIYSAHTAFVFLIPSMVSLSLLGQRLHHAFITGTIVLVSILYAYFFKALPMVPHAAETVDTSTTALLMVPLLMGFIVTVLTTMSVYSTISTISKISISEEDSKKQVDSLTGFFSSLKETINVGEDLNHSAENSLGLTNTIRENLTFMEHSVENLKKQLTSTQSIHQSIDEAGKVVKAGSENQSSAVEESASAVEEMATSIVEMSKTAESKRELIEQLVESEKEVAGQIKSGQKSFDLVKKSTGEMLNVVAVISDIAERTNLLAMNAAIEAAHAGSTGKGFAVVAQEIRKLAVEAGENSQKIKDIIENSIKGIDKAVEINSKVGTEFHSVSDQVKEIDGALSDIITGFNELAAGTNEITRVVENLAVINNSVNSSVNEVTDQLQLGRESIDQISSAATDISHNMSDIAGNSRSIREEAEKIYQIGKDNVSHIRMLEEKFN